MAGGKRGRKAKASLNFGFRRKASGRELVCASSFFAVKELLVRVVFEEIIFLKRQHGREVFAM